MSENEVQEKLQNLMLQPKVEKVTVNISVGRSGESLENAVAILEEITGQKPCRRKAKQTIREFGIRKGESIACIVTLRKERARLFLNKAFRTIGNQLMKNSFDRYGNFSFGIKEHIEMPGTKYVPELGIYGMNVSVTISRPGYRVKWRRRSQEKVGRKHLLNSEDAKSFIEREFDVEVVE